MFELCNLFFSKTKGHTCCTFCFTGWTWRNLTTAVVKSFNGLYTCRIQIHLINPVTKCLGLYGYSDRPVWAGEGLLFLHLSLHVISGFQFEICYIKKVQNIKQFNLWVKVCVSSEKHNTGRLIEHYLQPVRKEILTYISTSTKMYK